jgi:hypothetical protein
VGVDAAPDLKLFELILYLMTVLKAEAPTARGLRSSTPAMLEKLKQPEASATPSARANESHVGGGQGPAFKRIFMRYQAR